MKKIDAYYHEMGMCFIGEFDNGEDDYLEYTCYEDIPGDGRPRQLKGLKGFPLIIPSIS